jgi:isopropylmalate/homocitrate/citramalate synthase
LRDGEQMPGVSFTIEQKMKIAEKLDEIRVPQIEAGFPIVSKTEKKAVKTISNADLNAEILALSRLEKGDIDAVIDCNVDIILLFIASSDIHLKYKLKMKRGEIKERVSECVQYARDHGLRVSFSTEDTTRTELSFLKGLYTTALDAGAERIGITDTLGCATPEGIGRLTGEIRKLTKKTLSIHCHNDFGLALANALSALFSGANAVATTVNGIGERAGNVPLEEFVVSLKFLYGMDLGIDTKKFTELSTLVSRFSKVNIHKNKPIVGSNVFSHESGIHVAAILNNPSTYEYISPESVGNKRRLFMGKHTGSTYVYNKLKEKKLALDEKTIAKILADIKRVGEEDGTVSDTEFWRIVEKHLNIN